MKERERLVMGSLVALMLVFWLGFFFHRSAQFAGSFWGVTFAVSGTALMVAAMAYSLVKRIPSVKRAVTARVSMPTLLAWHTYLGVFGAILVILHTGHKFQSTLGIALTALTLAVVLSGFIGRHLMAQFSRTIREKKELLAGLETSYRLTAGELGAHPEQVAILRLLSGFWSRLHAGLLFPGGGAELGPAVRALRLAESMSDLEYAIKTHESFKRWFSSWLWLHIVLSVAVFLLIGLHIWAGYHFWLRWLA